MKRYLFVLSLVMCLSCSFLDETQPTDVKDVYDTPEALEANLRGLLVSLDNAASWTGEIHEKIISGSGIVHWSMSQSVTRLNSVEWTEALKFTASSSGSTASSFFSNTYYGIDRCNTLIAALAESTVDEEYKRGVEGEALFYRAFNYFNVVRFWGDSPLRLSPSDIENTSCPRTKYDRIYVQVIRDLEKAAELMRTPEQVMVQVPGESRPHKYAAYAYLSSVYLTIGSLLSHHEDNFWDPSKEGRAPDFSDLEIFKDMQFPLQGDGQYQDAATKAYAEALRYAEMLIPEAENGFDPNSPYRLCSKFSDLYSWSREFRDEFGNDSWNLPERIFVYSITPQSSTAYLPKRTLPPNVGGTLNVYKSDGNAGRQRPDRWFFQKWCETYPGNKGTKMTADVYVSSSDPRLDATMYHSSYFNQKADTTWNIYPKNMNYPTHYYGMPYFKKYFSTEYDYNAGYADLYLMRLTNVYLNAAEAAAFIGDEEKAYKYMEVLHARARNTKAGAKQPKWTPGQYPTRDSLMTAIFWERMFELCGEAGHEWFDTHRFGARWLVENIAKPKNVFLQLKEQNGAEDGSYKYGTSTTSLENKISYRQFYYGKDFLYTEDPAVARKGLLLGFPSREQYYNNEIDNIKNDYGY